MSNDFTRTLVILDTCIHILENEVMIMENRKLIYLFGCLFSLVFALIYYALFHTVLQDQDTSLTIYYNQVGLYKSDENAQSAIAHLKEQEIEAFLFPQDDVNAVICGVSASEAETKENGIQLSELEMNHIEKNITTKNAEAITAFQEKDMNKVLELIINESKTDE